MNRIDECKRGEMGTTLLHRYVDMKWVDAYTWMSKWTNINLLLLSRSLFRHEKTSVEGRRRRQLVCLLARKLLIKSTKWPLLSLFFFFFYQCSRACAWESVCPCLCAFILFFPPFLFLFSSVRFCLAFFFIICPLEFNRMTLGRSPFCLIIWTAERAVMAAETTTTAAVQTLSFLFFHSLGSFFLLLPPVVVLVFAFRSKRETPTHCWADNFEYENIQIAKKREGLCWPLTISHRWTCTFECLPFSRRESVA